MNKRHEMPADESPSYTIKSMPYVRVPSLFREQYPGWRNKEPTPLMTSIDGKVRLIYEWNESDILKPEEIQ